MCLPCSPLQTGSQGAGVGPAQLGLSNPPARAVRTRMCERGWRGREPSRTRCAIQTPNAPGAGSLNSN